jgi:hypothetical protein
MHCKLACLSELWCGAGSPVGCSSSCKKSIDSAVTRAPGATAACRKDAWGQEDWLVQLREVVRKAVGLQKRVLVRAHNLWLGRSCTQAERCLHLLQGT